MNFSFKNSFKNCFKKQFFNSKSYLNFIHSSTNQFKFKINLVNQTYIQKIVEIGQYNLLKKTISANIHKIKAEKGSEVEPNIAESQFNSLLISYFSNLLKHHRVSITGISLLKVLKDCQWTMRTRVCRPLSISSHIQLSNI